MGCKRVGFDRQLLVAARWRVHPLRGVLCVRRWDPERKSGHHTGPSPSPSADPAANNPAGSVAAGLGPLRSEILQQSVPLVAWYMRRHEVHYRRSSLRV